MAAVLKQPFRQDNLRGNIMVPTLDKEELRARMAQAAKPDTIDNVLHKRIMSGESKAERRMKMRMGKLMKSKIQPKNGLENVNA